MDCMIALNPDFPFRMRTASRERKEKCQGDFQLISRDKRTVVFYQRKRRIENDQTQTQRARHYGDLRPTICAADFEKFKVNEACISV